MSDASAYGGAQKDLPNPVDVFLARQAASHRPTAKSMLERMAAYFSHNHQAARAYPWCELAYDQLVELRSKLEREVSLKTAQNYLQTLRGVLKDCRRLGLLGRYDYDTLMELPPLTGERLPAGRHVEAEEFDQLFQYLGTLPDVPSLRDRAALAVLRGTGMRRAEACALTLDGYDPANQRLVVNRGKGNKQRVVFLPEWVVAAVEDWMVERGYRPGALLCVCDRHGNVRPARHMAPKSLWHRFRRHVVASQVREFTLHDLRRTYAGMQFEAGHDPVKIQKAMGHSRVDQTARYDRRTEDTRRDLALSVPAPLPAAPRPR